MAKPKGSTVVQSGSCSNSSTFTLRRKGKLRTGRRRIEVAVPIDRERSSVKGLEHINRKCPPLHSLTLFTYGLPNCEVHPCVVCMRYMNMVRAVDAIQLASSRTFASRFQLPCGYSNGFVLPPCPSSPSSNSLPQEHNAYHHLSRLTSLAAPPCIGILDLD
jgi:hypothetical protein